LHPFLSLDLGIDEDLAYHVRGLRVIDQIATGDQEHGPSPQILNGMSDTWRNGESSHYPLRDLDILHSLPIAYADSCRSLYGEYLCTPGVIVVTAYAAGFRHHHMQIPLTGKTRGF
jgi:hypothetical protein